MAGNTWDPLKDLLSTELQDSLGKLWNNKEDQDFLRYNAEKVAKYVTLYCEAKTDDEKQEARFNLDMLQASVAAYVHQKAIIAGQHAEEIAKRVVSLVIGILLKTAAR
jgi:hypothetical protein